MVWDFQDSCSRLEEGFAAVPLRDLAELVDGLAGPVRMRLVRRSELMQMEARVLERNPFSALRGEVLFFWFAKGAHISRHASRGLRSPLHPFVSAVWCLKPTYDKGSAEVQHPNVPGLQKATSARLLVLKESQVEGLKHQAGARSL